ncbi:hypothetical protein O181_075010 [Austropuccinia psidii MF-1]|uniref:Uncharacterized protein n=1 Tax=Austropuccinia psidii MF-1 TaxID=1389203 RepID=A0A9Q3FDJ9_9BASI|nr:hypothetical protein [Austropuccinia psidii MF-1]
MSASTHSKKATANNAEPKPLLNNDMYSMLNSLRAKVMSLKSAHNSNAAKMQSLGMAISSPRIPLFSSIRHLHTTSSCRNRTMWLTVLLHSKATAQSLRSGPLVSTEFSVWPSTLKRLSTIYPLLSMIDYRRKIGPSAILSMLQSHTSLPCVLESTPLELLQGSSSTQSKPAAALEIILKNSVLFVRGSLCWSKTAQALHGQKMCWFFHYATHLQYSRSLGSKPIN